MKAWRHSPSIAVWLPVSHHTINKEPFCGLPILFVVQPGIEPGFSEPKSDVIAFIPLDNTSSRKRLQRYGFFFTPPNPHAFFLKNIKAAAPKLPVLFWALHLLGRIDCRTIIAPPSMSYHKINGQLHDNYMFIYYCLPARRTIAGRSCRSRPDSGWRCCSR